MTSEIPAPPPATPVGRPPRNWLARIGFAGAVAALVLGLIPFVGLATWILALGGIVVAIVALVRPEREKWYGVAGVVAAQSLC